MSDLWKPELASLETEKMMEECDVTEEDRDEIRRFCEFLQIQNKKLKGARLLESLPEAMKDWVLGRS